MKTKITKHLKAIFLMGPTASGKTKMAIELQQYLPIELISVDSSLVYRELNIGTAKPSLTELIRFPHRLINIRDPAESYSVANFYQDAIIEIYKVFKNNHIPLLVGGSMMYFKTLLEGLSQLPPANLKLRQQIEKTASEKGTRNLHNKLSKIDPVAGKRIHPNDLKRISRALEVFFSSGKTLTELIQTPKKKLPFKIYQFAIIPSNKDILYNNITSRFKKMLDLGFENETRKLFTRGDLHINMPSIRSVGYRQMWSYILGNISYNEMITQAILATKKLAKHQLTWLRGWNEKIYWLNSDNITFSRNTILQVLNTKYD